MSRILGLDLGSYTVKAVLLDPSRREAPVQGYFEVARSQEGDRLDTLRQALTELLQRHAPHADQVVVALPGPAHATHSLALPFMDAKKLEAALPFEVEGQLPFDLDQAVYDYQVTAQSAGRSELLVGVARKEELASLLQVLSEVGLDPRIVTHPAACYQNLWLQHPERFGGDGAPVAVVDIGHERTSLAVGTAGGTLEAARTFAGGGKDLTRALAAELQVTAAEANHWKEHQGAVGPRAEGPDEQRVAAALTRGLQPVVRELRATLKAYTARTHRQVARIYLCGGVARLPGLTEQLSADLGVPVEAIASGTDLSAAAPGSSALAAQGAYGLALRALVTGAKGPRFNLRRGEFAFKGHYDYLKVRIGRIAAYAAALILLFMAYYASRNAMLSAREAAVDAQLCKVTQSVLGRCEKNYDRALNMIQGKESPAAAVPKISAVDLLAEMSSRVPSDVKVTFDQIIVEPDRVSVRGTTVGSKEVDRISQALKAFRCFHEVQVGKLEKTKDDHVNFRLEVQVDCPEQPAQKQG